MGDIMYSFDLEYNRICNNVLTNGTMIKNERTGKNCLTYFGDMMKFDLSTGYFPLITTKKVLFTPIVAELIGFLRGYDNAKQFRELNCNIWNANANESKHWVENKNRKGHDDLGRIYGVQARDWQTPTNDHIDQLKNVVDKLLNNIDDRRLIVNHWNPGELDMMALPPCHMTYIFGLNGDTLNLSMLQRSCDLPLGIPFNIASYALLLNLIAKITNKKVGVFTHFMWNIHVYEDQIELLRQQMLRQPYENACKLLINDDIKSLHDIDTWVTPNDFYVTNYRHHPFIKYPFSE